MGMKGSRWFYMDNPSTLDNINDLAEHLHSLLSSATYVAEFPGSDGPVLIEAKELIEKIDNLKIEIYSNEHPPPHFHVVAPSVNAVFSLDNCTLIDGKISSKNKKKIEYWFHHENAKQSLIEVWNRTRPFNCVVGRYEEE